MQRFQINSQNHISISDIVSAKTHFENLEMHIAGTQVFGCEFVISYV